MKYNPENFKDMPHNPEVENSADYQAAQGRFIEALDESTEESRQLLAELWVDGSLVGNDNPSIEDVLQSLEFGILHRVSQASGYGTDLEQIISEAVRHYDIASGILNGDTEVIEERRAQIDR